MKTAALVLLALLPVPLAAQGLGDAAAKEQKKRERQAKPPKAFTDADLPSRVAPSESGDEGGSKPSTQSSQTAPPESADDASAVADPLEKDPLEKERQERKLLEAEWRVRFANAREHLAVAEAACWQEVVRTQFYQGIPVQMKVKEFVETEEFRRAKKALADLEEEFRRTGLPPGWAREQ